MHKASPVKYIKTKSNRKTSTENGYWFARLYKMIGTEDIHEERDIEDLSGCPPKPKAKGISRLRTKRNMTKK